jgi:hypothetical protein
VKVISRPTRLRPVGFAIVIVITDRGLVINSVASKNVDCSSSLLPLRLPARRRRLRACAIHVAITVDGITPAVDDVAQANHHSYV